MTPREELREHLFGRSDRRLLNFGLTRGDAVAISSDQIREQICSIFRQHDAGLKATGPVKSARPKTDIRALVRTL